MEERGSIFSYKDLKVRTKIISGYIVVLVLMVVMTLVLLRNLSSLTSDFAFLVEHDQPVLSNAALMEKLVVDMETGERGFLITGKDEFLEPYEKGMGMHEELYKTEKELVSDNPPQVALLEEIDQVIRKWIRVAAEPEIAKLLWLAKDFAITVLPSATSLRALRQIARTR